MAVKISPFSDAVDKLTSLFREGVWSQATTAHSSTAATPMSTDDIRTHFSGADNRIASKRWTRGPSCAQTREPSLVWAMQSHRSVDSEVRDYILYPGRVETPEGRLTSVDPNFPTDCYMDQLWSFRGNSELQTQKLHASLKMKAEPETMDRPKRSERDRSFPVDLLDQYVTNCIRDFPNAKVIRRGYGKYEINNRLVMCRWIDERHDSVMVVDGPLTQPLLDYVSGVEETAVYDREGGDFIGRIAKTDRLSFGDEHHDKYTRLEAMRVAKEQAKLRESAAKISEDSNAYVSNYHNFEEHLSKYRMWHTAQLQADAPLYQQDAEDAQVVHMLQAPQAPHRPDYRQQAEQTLPPYGGGAQYLCT